MCNILRLECGFFYKKKEGVKPSINKDAASVCVSSS